MKQGSVPSSPKTKQHKLKTRALFAVAASTACLATHAQPNTLDIDLDGAASLETYSGLQPELIKGVSSENAWDSVQLRHICLVSPDTLQLTVEAQNVVSHPLTPYIPEDSDALRDTSAGYEIPERLWEAAHLAKIATPAQRERGTASAWPFIDRDSEPLGWLVGPERDWLWPVQTMTGPKLDTLWADEPASYLLARSDATEAPLTPIAISRKTKPHHKGSDGPSYNGGNGQQHQLFLKFSKPLSPNAHYTLYFQGESPFETNAEFYFAPERLRSEAIHVNLAGYHPQQPKIAFASSWMGKGLEFELPPHSIFKIVDTTTGDTRFEGPVTLKRSPDTPELQLAQLPAQDHTLSRVYEMDFSALQDPGLYRLVIETVGCSFDFAIDESLWQAAIRLQMLGFLNQRSGIELKPPLTQYRRPLNFHPDLPHHRAHLCDPKLFFDYNPAEGQRDDNPFYRIERSLIPGSHDPEAWGSWADAADHDRRTQGFRAIHAMLDLFEYNPKYFEALPLRVPEKNNNIPDILDEALWGAELYRRTQREDGGIIGGIESLRHPNRGEPSWLDTLPLAVIPPSPYSAYRYVSVASRLALALQPYAPEIAEKYQSSAQLAYEWALSEQGLAQYGKRFNASEEDIALANLHLYRLTQTPEYHVRYAEEIRNIYGDNLPTTILDRKLIDQRELCQYLQLEAELADPKLRKSIESAILKAANALIDGANESDFRILRRKGHPYFYWLVESEGTRIVIAAHQLTGDAKYLDALALSSQFAMGVNPLNLSYTSGLGERFAYPMIMDAEYAQLSWPGGIATYGPNMFHKDDFPERAWGWDQRRRESHRGSLHPSNIFDWPQYELYFRYTGFTALNEFTIQQTMTDQLYRWGYLAQQYEK